ncbi:precorrin-6A/cobalt-precorrin-6A reductase [Oceanotoga sp. DSM 15011]|uniref:Precorrin-6A reductase n=1 Tax=Oceanotoga teriensis TaxID=515440 RepID=A0AA45C9D0_9BACT|nr:MULTISPECIES: precorrin-6A/cobalt-precorrin-6A reductase [Oceanotoga]MDN5342935.1 precorrin-6A/cobalt-precorrin-6A reductase [Oceanotoga sp.]PWJ96666.1 precorrin-6A reductase [Oceanotoga teriensis]UYP00163.1 precorrin-6A/cobalt-precorrin-6A reductase [Oceanotoga sp. DSM 15011]
MRIGIIGGTSESKELANFLYDKNIKFNIHFKNIYSKFNNNTINSRINSIRFFNNKIIVKTDKTYFYDLLIDMSHPFAKNIKKLYINLPKNKVLRFSRGSSNFDKKYYGYDTMTMNIIKKHTKILSLMGYKGTTEIIKSLNKISDINNFLIVSRSIEKINYGINFNFEPSKIFDIEWFEEIIKKYDISCVLIKDSGSQSKTKEKIEFFLSKNIEIFLLSYKENTNKKIFYDMEKLKKYIMKKVNFIEKI